jgi:hypothetical protein
MKTTRFFAYLGDISLKGEAKTVWAKSCTEKRNILHIQRHFIVRLMVLKVFKEYF